MTPTPAALRSAKRILEAAAMLPPDPAQAIAEIVDAETRVADLIDALDTCVRYIGAHWAGQPNNAPEFLDRLTALLQEARNGKARNGS